MSQSPVAPPSWLKIKVGGMAGITGVLAFGKGPEKVEKVHQMFV